MNRRDFIKTSVIGLTTSAIGIPFPWNKPKPEPRRIYVGLDPACDPDSQLTWTVVKRLYNALNDNKSMQCEIILRGPK